MNSTIRAYFFIAIFFYSIHVCSGDVHTVGRFNIDVSSDLYNPSIIAFVDNKLELYAEKNEFDQPKGHSPSVSSEVSESLEEYLTADSEIRTVWRSVVGQPFIRLGVGNVSSPPILNGNFQLNENTAYITSTQTIIDVKSSESRLDIHGDLIDTETGATFGYVFTLEDHVPLLDNDGLPVLKFQISISSTPDNSLFNRDPSSMIPRVYFYAESRIDESFHGFGESFTYFSYKGLRVPVLVSEQGVGRGVEPITTYNNKIIAEGVGGHWYTTYAPKAIYLTNYNHSIMIDESVVMFIDLTDPYQVEFEVWSDSVSGFIFYGTSWHDLIKSITSITGRQPGYLPEWSQKGAIVGLEGGSANVSKIVNEMIDFGVPIKGVWLQDWVGLRHNWDGDRLIWNWELNRDYYPNWSELVHEWKLHDTRVLTYISPFFSNPANYSSTPHNFYEEGIKYGYFVKRSDGTPYRMYSLSIEFCMLDPTNPNAVQWMIDIIKNFTYTEASSSGFMCDFGEYLPFDAILDNGMTGVEYHNKYPELWANIAMQATVESNKLDDALYFMRSAWTRSPSNVPVFWLGDQLVSWDGNDGLRTVITGALSSGLTGHSITHSDIGGYTVVTSPSCCQYIRSSELLKRWTELATFGSGIFRTHIGSSTTPLDAQVYDTEDSMAHFRKFAMIFGQLSEYREKLMKDAHSTGIPLMRPMVLEYAYDQTLWKPNNDDLDAKKSYLDHKQEQYMFGEEFLVAPVLDEGATVVNVYLPAMSGEWIHIWSGSSYKAGDEGLWIENLSAELGYPGIFYKSTSITGQHLYEFIISNGFNKDYLTNDSNNHRGASEMSILSISKEATIGLCFIAVGILIVTVLFIKIIILAWNSHAKFKIGKNRNRTLYRSFSAMNGDMVPFRGDGYKQVPLKTSEATDI